VCDDTGLVKQAVEGRSRAAECFERCKPFEDSDEGLAMAAVLVDVLRRAGRLADGAAECDALLGRPGATGVLRQVLRFQARLIARDDRGCFAVSDCLETA
jgi:hypothetical protein